MKNLKLFIGALVLTLFTTTTTFAFTETNAKNNLRSELITLLGEQSSVEINYDILKANVSFLINDKNEIVVISIDSKNKKIETYVKGKLNYKKVRATGITKGKIYIVPLKIEKAK